MANVTNAGKDGTYPELRRPFVVQEEYVAGGDPRYALLDRRGRGHLISDTAEQGDRHWACTLRPQETLPGFILEVHGAPQHVIAKDTFTATDDTDEQDWYGEVDWRDFRFTVCAEFHEYCEAEWPPARNAGDDIDSVLHIRCPHKRFDYMQTGTVLDVDDEGQLVTTDGGLIQDDRVELQNIARAAYEWYANPRAALEIETHSLDASFPSLPGQAAISFGLGYLVHGIGNGDTFRLTNCIVNKVSFNLRAGSLRIATAFTDFDFARAT
jgi:hypothetical protein